ncbi:TonB-dependent receptor domain-containing protein [Actibacterium sp. 188UL27-1]|uniref:TonB-dependent receptor domain-containing protein n=1 Tax=Actibacterium sp. 188UL27-1 TaxID=2786961 RepID=UPI00195D4C1D|nr:TonB-dependent receptor [Actibacterium sp. 188UL27-1]MBM7067094.1 TonB-dependent receptor [Actibacterium sp. 188UL27-1]
MDISDRRAAHSLLATILIMLVGPAARAQDQDGFDLGTITIGESKREVQTDTAAAVTEVDQEEINDRQAGTVAELIDSVPGVNLVNGSTPQGSGINIRGFGANSTFGTDQKVGIVVDGALVGSEEIYRIGTQLFTDPELFRSVRVFRGTIGTFEYGSGIIGGLVELETKDASDFTDREIGFRFRQSLQFGSNGDGITSSSIFAWQPTDDFEVLGQFVWREQDLQTDGAGNTIGNSDFQLPSGMVKGTYTFGTNGDQRLTFKYSETTASDRDVQYDTFLTTDAVFGNVDRDTDSRTAVLRYQFNPADNDMVDLDVTLSYADQSIDQEYVSGSSICDRPTNPCGLTGGFPVGGFPVVNADQQYETTKLTVRNTSLFATGAVNHELRMGVEFIRRERLNADSAPGGIDNRWALFAVNDMRIGEDWTITPALRYESSQIEGSTSPNDGTFDNDAVMGGLSVRYAFGNGFALFGSAAYTESLPIIDDLGNATLMTQSEKARTLEFGGSYEGQDVFRSGDTFAIKANIYNTRIWDVTSYTVPGNQQITGVPASVYPEDIETRGIELEASYAMQSGFYVDLNANVTRGTEQRLNGSTADWRNIPADGLQLTLGRRFGEALDLSWEMVADQRMTRTTDPSAGFAVHNLRATYQPQAGVLEGSELRIGVENLFDREYTRHLSTRPAPGRNIKVTLARTF